MARLIEKLTPLAVTKTRKAGYYGDGAGLWLQVSASGSKSWIFRFTLNKKQREMGLGAVHTVTLPEARAKAKGCRLLLLDGKDPLEARRVTKMADAMERAKMMTFDQCAKAYILAHKAGWKNAKHGDQWTNTLNTYASPVFGHFPVAEIDTGLVVKCLAPIWESKTETASRLRGRIESVLGWATTSGYRTGENPARWKGHLENLLATISKTSRTKNHPSLPWPRIGAFISALRLREGVAARALEFTILTACRSGEVRGARWAEFDTAGKMWTIPADRMKAKREHQVPLSDAALALLESLSKEGEIVFAGTKSQPLSDMSLTAVIRRMNGDDKPVWVDTDGESITVHGFRSSFRMWAAETTSYPREVAEHALAHQLPDAVERAYQRGSQFAKRAALMAEWAVYCTTVQTDAVVKPIRGAA
jgi:integrase